MANSKIPAFLMGLFAGTATGILLAPHKGSKTRKKIYKAAANLLSSANDKASELGGNITDGLKSLKKETSQG